MAGAELPSEFPNPNNQSELFSSFGWEILGESRE